MKNKAFKELLKLSENDALDSLLGQAQQRQAKAEEQRKQDVHEQQLRFNEDKHQLGLQELSLKLEQSQQSFQLNQEQEQQRAQEQSEYQQQSEALKMQEQQMTFETKQRQAQAKEEAQQRKMQDQEEKKQKQEQEQQAQQQQQDQQQKDYTQQAQNQQQVQRQQNLMAKSGQEYAPPDRKMPTLGLASAGLGAGMGGLGAHFIAPSKATAKYRELAKAITPEQVTKSRELTKALGGKGLSEGLPKDMLRTVSDVTHKGKNVRFKVPQHVAKRYFLDRALQANANRLVGGAGAGLLAGILIQKAME